jgi:hypothetical protein
MDLPDIWPEAFREEMKARFIVSLGFMGPPHLREEVGEARFAERSSCTSKGQQSRGTSSITRQQIVDEDVSYVRVQDRHDGTRRMYQVHGVNIGEGIWTDCVGCARRFRSLVTWSKNF